MTAHDHQNQSGDDNAAVDAATMQSLSVMRMYHAGLMQLKDLWIAHAAAKQQLRMKYSSKILKAVAVIEGQAAEQVAYLDKLDKIQDSLRKRSKTSCKTQPPKSESSSSESNTDSTPGDGPEYLEAHC